MNYVYLPTVALRGMTVLPGMVIHFDISRKKSINAVEEALNKDQKIFLVCQTDIEVADPARQDVYDFGTIARIKQIIKLPNGVIRVQVEGIKKAEIKDLYVENNMLYSKLEVVSGNNLELDYITNKAMLQGMRELLQRYAYSNQKISKDTINQLLSIKDAKKLMSRISMELPMEYQDRQRLLEVETSDDLYQELAKLIIDYVNAAEIRAELENKVKDKIEKNQKDYIIREELKILNEELNQEDPESEIDEFFKKTEELSASEEIKSGIKKAINRYKSASLSSLESNVERSYVETLLSLPWDYEEQDNFDINQAEEILNRDHYGLMKVKERIIEALAVRNVTKESDAPIICLVGPPGTGKTSVVKSVADAMNKKYVRVCLGGVRDEAEIRGHRKTYVGAMPGRIIDGIKKAGCKNPVMLLDEVDKVSSDYRSDTSAALLEVLDGEQNKQFIDHYVELPVDLSKVLFIATVNDLSGISKPLLDRMEIIEVNSYTKNEKMHIAKDYLVPKQLKKNGLMKKDIKFTDKALGAIIDGYTKEAGVRNLEREIAKICRKQVRNLYNNGEISHPEKPATVTEKNLSTYLGKVKYREKKPDKEKVCGVVCGLAWTAVGGTTLEIEVSVMPGKESLILTGQMGDVMKESARIALSYVRSYLAGKKHILSEDFFEKNSIHIHIPEGAVPKDGPSAGITLATAIYSALTESIVDRSVAMTGELTLRGRVLAIGGLMEKILAAKSAGIKKVLVPKENEADVAELDKEITDGIQIVYVSDVSQVLSHAILK